MVEAFVLINCDFGKEKQVVEHLHTLRTVKEVQATVGVYDIIAKLESETKKDLDNTIKSKILKIKQVNCVLTLESE
ncbi:MAG: Lrp/AsnC ligand binding domain-containing protein [Nitrosotalea sp.]